MENAKTQYCNSNSNTENSQSKQVIATCSNKTVYSWEDGFQKVHRLTFFFLWSVFSPNLSVQV